MATEFLKKSPVKDPEKQIKWKKVDCVIKDRQGREYFSMKSVEAPEGWSQRAIEIAAAKFFRKTGVRSLKGSEKSIRQMVRRVSERLAKAGVEQKILSPKEAPLFEKQIRSLLLQQKGFFNSPVWFNYGLFQAYKIKGQNTCWRWNPKLKKIQKSEEAFEHPQVSACFIQKVEDNLESIFDLVKNEARLFKYGSGSGTNFSTLRSKYEKLEGGGTSSGLLSFLEVLDRGAGSVKSGGTTRRAAKMVILDIDHPEIEEFIEWKAREEKKAKALMQAGFGTDFESEAYRTVSGQNSNNSVRVNDEFLKAVVLDRPFALRARTDGKPCRTVSAKFLWNKIAQSAWECADPGLQFENQIQAWHTCPESGPIRASNPCSEYMFLDDSACNLASLNLLKFLDAEGNFQIEDFVQAARSFYLAQEILVDDASYPTEMIAQNSHRFRPLGLGIAGLGAFLMRKAIPYDSDEGRAWASGITALLTGVAYELSAQLAKEKGAFEGFRSNKKQMLKVIEKHQKFLRKIQWGFLPEPLNNRATEAWAQALQLGKKFGFRNAQATVLAPTGTIGLVMDSETTGIEPEFSLVTTKKLSGGGEIRLVSEAFLKALEKLSYSNEDIKEIQLFVDLNGSLQDCARIKPEHRKIFETALEISPQGHLKMMAALQPFVSGAISKTVNLPKSATVQDIEKLYLEAWKSGLKSIAIYRDGSKGSQPLESLKPKGEKIREEAFPKCFECGSPTELAGGCFRCVNCGTVLGCA